MDLYPKKLQKLDLTTDAEYVANLVQFIIWTCSTCIARFFSYWHYTPWPIET